jgi:hypothetical protein
MDDTRPLEILLLCDWQPHIASTVLQHIEALTGLSRHRVRALAMLGDLPSALDLRRFDVIVIHYSLVASSDAYVSPEARRRIAASPAAKALFIQDEYRHVDRSIAAFKALGVDLLFTCVPPAEIEKVYPAALLPGVRKLNVLTGYVDESLVRRRVPAYHERPIDVGYRSRRVPAWLGDLGQEKWRIGIRFKAEAAQYGLVCDISYREEERLYGEQWIRFVTRCRAMLGVESGASVFDFTGDIQRRVDADLLREPGLSYEVLRERHFAAEDGKIRLNQISPRCFEAAALRTLMVLYPGDYSGVLVPWRHYVPLAKDHGNMAEVAAIIRDPARAQPIIDAAYREIACDPAYGFTAFVRHFDEEVSRSAAGRAPARAYDDARFAADSRGDFHTRRRRLQRAALLALYRGFFRGVLGSLPEGRRDAIQGQLRRVLAALRPMRRGALSLGAGRSVQEKKL